MEALVEPVEAAKNARGARFEEARFVSFVWCCYNRRTRGKGADTSEIEVAKNDVAYTTLGFQHPLEARWCACGASPISDLI